MTSKSEFQDKFNSIAKNYDLISNPYTVQRRSESLKLESTELILETGSGSGLVTKSYNSKIICTDFSFEMCKESKQRQEFVICCDAEFLPFKKNIFDAIISAEMIYYLEKPENFIKYSKKILKPHGKLSFAFPNEKMIFIDKIRTFFRKLGFSKMYFDDGIHDFIKINNLKSMLTNNGFKINSIEKQILFPFRILDKLNKILEKTPLNYFSIFIILHTESQNN
jgi:ubiquinone/menaquinone biosynthesis C-methylase UbiE